MVPILPTKKVIDTILASDRKLNYADLKLRAYFEAFKEHYDNIHWSGMDIEKEQVAYMLGMEDNIERDPRRFAKPMDMYRKSFL